MGLFGGDKKITQNTTNVDEDNFSSVDNRIFEDAGFVEGNIAISGTGNSIVKTDYGALDAANSAFSSVGSAFGVVGDSFSKLVNSNRDTAALAYESVVDLNRSNNDLALTTSELAIDAANNFASRTFDVVADTHDFASDLNGDSLDFASTTFSNALALIERDADASRQRTANEISKAYDLAATHSRSEGAEAMGQAVKVMMWGGAGLGLILIFSQWRNSKNG